MTGFGAHLFPLDRICPEPHLSSRPTMRTKQIAKFVELPEPLAELHLEPRLLVLNSLLRHPSDPRLGPTDDAPANLDGRHRTLIKESPEDHPVRRENRSQPFLRDRYQTLRPFLRGQKRG